MLPRTGPKRLSPSFTYSGLPVCGKGGTAAPGQAWYLCHRGKNLFPAARCVHGLPVCLMFVWWLLSPCGCTFHLLLLLLVACCVPVSCSLKQAIDTAVRERLRHNSELWPGQEVSDCSFLDGSGRRFACCICTASGWCAVVGHYA